MRFILTLVAIAAFLLLLCPQDLQAQARKNTERERARMTDKAAEKDDKQAKPKAVTGSKASTKGKPTAQSLQESKRGQNLPVTDDAKDGSKRPGSPNQATNPNGKNKQNTPANLIANMQRMLIAADQNKDGKISKTEAPDRLKARFEQLDSNSDGQLEKSEFATMFRKMAERQQENGGKNQEAQKKRLQEAKNRNQMAKDTSPVKPIRPGTRK